MCENERRIDERLRRSLPPVLREMALCDTDHLVDCVLDHAEHLHEPTRLVEAEQEEAHQHEQGSSKKEPAYQEDRVHRACDEHRGETDDRDDEDRREIPDLRKDRATRGRTYIKTFAVGIVDDECNTGCAREQAERVDEHEREDEHDIVPKSGLLTNGTEGFIV